MKSSTGIAPLHFFVKNFESMSVSPKLSEVLVNLQSIHLQLQPWSAVLQYFVDIGNTEVVVFSANKKLE